MFLLCKHVRLTCGFNKLMMMMIIPGAQVTRKLAISLVDASRVFEVFVAVVLIGEHLPASFALISSVICTHTNTSNTVPAFAIS